MSFDDLGSFIVSIANGFNEAIREVAAVFEGDGGFMLMFGLLVVAWYVLAA